MSSAPKGSEAAKTRTPAAMQDDLELLIRSRYPIIYVLTWEEYRVEQHLAAIAQRRGKQLYCWSVTSGMTRAGGAPGAARQKGLSDPIEALDTVIEYKDPAIYLFKDFHPFMKDGQGNVAVIRKLREVAQALSNSYKTLVITSPVMEYAGELTKDITVLDYPLPTANDFDALYKRISQDITPSNNVQLCKDGKDLENLLRAALGLTLQEAENVFAKTMVSEGRLTGDTVSAIFAEKQQIIRKSGLLEYYESAAGVGDVGGLDNLKEWLNRRSLAFSEGARKFGLPAPKGVLLIGVQGCGKSLCAKAVSKLWNMPLLRFDMGRMFSSLVGSSEENIRRAISVAESIAPVVLWADEIDKAFSGAQGSGMTDGGTTARVMSTFLTWLNEKQKPVFVMATANDISQLPPELLRKGRLDEIFFVDLPNVTERREIFRIHITKRGRKVANFDLDKLVEASEGFSGAEIEEAIISALFDVFYLDKELETADLLKSLGETVPLSKTMSEKISGLRAWADGRARPASSPDQAKDNRAHRKLEF
ncbi:MAG: AAA family ATPase [Phycisphaerae bacterium]|jgi:AAA+ superfamily predicted ATPase